MYSRNVAAGGPTIPRQGAAAGAEPNDESWLPGEPNPSSALWPEFAPEAAGQVNDWSVRPQETTRTHPQTDRAQAPPVSDPRRVNWATWEPNPNLVDTPPSQKQPEISWDSAQGYPPRQAHSAQVPPVAGAYPLPPHVYNSAQVPYQPSRSEPLFVPVNPFEPRWRGAPLRAQQQPIDLDNDLDVAPSGPRPGQSTAYARYPTQPHSAESSSNDHWMHPSGPPPAQSAASAAYPTRPQPTDFANNPVWIGADLPHPPLRGQNPAYPVWANAPTRGPFIPFVPEFFPQPAFIPFIPPGPGPTLGVVAPQLHPDSVPVPTNGNESNDIERVARSRPACARCKTLRVKCDFETQTSTTCKRCFNDEHKCVILGRKSRSALVKRKEPVRQTPEPATEIPQREDSLSELGEWIPPIPVEEDGWSWRSRAPHHMATPVLPSHSSASLENVTFLSPSSPSPLLMDPAHGSESRSESPASRLATPSSLAASESSIAESALSLTPSSIAFSARARSRNRSSHRSRSRHSWNPSPPPTGPLSRSESRIESAAPRLEASIAETAFSASSISSMESRPSSRSRSPRRRRSATERSQSPQRPWSPVFVPDNPTVPVGEPGRISSRPDDMFPPAGPIPYPFPFIPPSSSNDLPPPVTSRMSSKSPFLPMAMSLMVFVLFDFVPGQLYFHFLLRIPSLYFSRVTRIFEDARLSLPDIKRMACANADQWSPSSNVMWIPTPDQMPLPRSLLQLRTSWENFIDSLMREWKTFNIISVLLMSAILTMLQIESASHPITRVSALLSLICALMSLLYGCMYIIRFGTMRKMHKASSFANEARKRTTSIWWNIWVLLAMPAVWLAWSIVTFLTCIMSFIWLSGSSQDEDDNFVVSPRAALGCRVGLTVVFALGVIYFVLIVRTFHRYGDPLDREWMRAVNEWTKEAYPGSQNPHSAPQPASGPPHPSARLSLRSIPPEMQFRPPVVPPSEEDTSWIQNFAKIPLSNPVTSRPSAFFKTPHPASSPPAEPVTIMQLSHSDVEARIAAYGDPKWADAVTASDWHRFMTDISSAWRGQLALKPLDAAAASDADLPVYRLLSPTRPENPIPPSAESGAGFITHSSSHGARSITSSESSYGRPKPSTYMTAAFSAPGASLPTFPVTEITFENPITEGDQKTKSLSASPTQSPADDMGPSPLRTQPEEQSESDPAPDPAQSVRDFIHLWNERYFHARNLEASLVVQHDSSGRTTFSVNLASKSDESVPGNPLTKTASEESLPAATFMARR